MAATSWNRAGNTTVRAARATVTRAVLERLAERLEHVTVELGQLIEEQDPVVRPGDLARRQSLAAADEGCGDACDAAPGTAARGGAHDRALAGRRGHDRDRQRGRVVERRQQSGDRPRQEGLADARRAGQEQPVAAGQGDLEGPARLLLAANLGEIRDRDR